MSQHDMDLSNQAGAAFRADLNNALVALVGSNNGATEPTTKFAFMPWADTANDLFKIRNAANTGWISLFTISTGAAIVSPETKDTSGGLVGLTTWKINFRNAANTFTSWLVNSCTATRTYTFQDRNGTIADDTDLGLKANLNSPTFTGTPAAPTASVNTSTTQLATTAYVVAQIADDAPTKGGSGATGTWGISITGTAANNVLKDVNSSFGVGSIINNILVGYDYSATVVSLGTIAGSRLYIEIQDYT